MTRIALCIAFLTIASYSFAADAPPEPADIKPLFNGKDLTGWDGDPRLWSVKDGVIRGETTKENAAKGNTFLVCKEGVLKDFELRLTFRAGDANNSGIQYRSKHITEGNVANKWVVRGYQHEIRNSGKIPNVSGFIYDEGGKRGRIIMVGQKGTWEPATADELKAYNEKKATDKKLKEPAGKLKVTETLMSPEDYAKLFKVNEWNDVIIIARGNNIQHYMNGKLVLDFTDDPALALKEGIVALQLHAGAPMWVEYKNLKLKQLGN